MTNTCNVNVATAYYIKNNEMKVSFIHISLLGQTNSYHIAQTHLLLNCISRTHLEIVRMDQGDLVTSSIARLRICIHFTKKQQMAEVGKKKDCATGVTWYWFWNCVANNESRLPSTLFVMITRTGSQTSALQIPCWQFIILSCCFQKEISLTFFFIVLQLQ